MEMQLLKHKYKTLALIYQYHLVLSNYSEIWHYFYTLDLYPF